MFSGCRRDPGSKVWNTGSYDGLYSSENFIFPWRKRNEDFTLSFHVIEGLAGYCCRDFAWRRQGSTGHSCIFKLFCSPTVSGS